MTLEEVVQQGKEYNLSLRALDLEILNQKRAVDTSFNVFFPKIDTSATFGRTNATESGSVVLPVPASEIPGTGVYDKVTTQSYEVDPWFLRFSITTSLAFSPAIFDGISLVKADYAAGLLKRQEAERRLERDLKKQFYSLLLLEEQINIYLETQRTAEARYQQNLTDYQNGRVSELSVLNSQVAFENTIPLIYDLQRSYSYYVDLFKSTLGIERTNDIELVGHIELPAVDLESIVWSPQNRFDVRAQNATIELAEYQKAAEFRTDFFPSFILSFDYSPVLVDPFNSTSWNDTGSLSFSVGLPLDSFLPSSPARMNQERLENQIRALELSRQQLSELGQVEISNTLNALEGSLQAIRALELSLRSNQRNVELVQEAYGAGIRNLLELDNAEDELRQAQLNLLNEKYRYLSYLFDLEYQIDTPLYVPLGGE